MARLHGSRRTVRLPHLRHRPHAGDELETISQGPADRQPLLVLLGSIFWNTACLIVDSAGLVEDEDEEIPAVVESVGLKKSPKEELIDEDNDETDDEIDDDEEENVYQRANDYINMVADDNELMQIFERTYGPVRRKVASYTVKKSAPEQKKHQKSKPVKLGDEYLLVDGYNIIFAWDELKELAKDNLNMARDRLIDILCNYQGFKQCNLILVFDAYKVKGNVGSAEKIHNINVVYTKEAETADMYIEKITHEIGKKHRVRVATSDNLEQIIILGNGATRLSANELLQEVKLAEKTIMDIINSN